MNGTYFIYSGFEKAKPDVSIDNDEKLIRVKIGGWVMLLEEKDIQENREEWNKLADYLYAYSREV